MCKTSSIPWLYAFCDAMQAHRSTSMLHIQVKKVSSNCPYCFANKCSWNWTINLSFVEVAKQSIFAFKYPGSLSAHGKALAFIQNAGLFYTITISLHLLDHSFFCWVVLTWIFSSHAKPFHWQLRTAALEQIGTELQSDTRHYICDSSFFSLPLLFQLQPFSF